jgi:DNA invertase Pin-like site-specific DNA recombinase
MFKSPFQSIQNRCVTNRDVFQPGRCPAIERAIRRTMEDRGDSVVASYLDGARITGRGKYAEWTRLLADLDAVDQVALTHAGDIPGKTVNDLLKILGILRDRGVGIYVHTEQIDTASSGFALLDLIRACRRAKLSQAIRNGQAKAVAAGKRIGRPRVPRAIASRIQAALTEGGGIRSTARMYNVSPASVINIRRARMATQCTS